jgi:hypothetical protein
MADATEETLQLILTKLTEMSAKLDALDKLNKVC